MKPLEPIVWSRVTDVRTRYGASAQLVMTVKGGTVNGFTMVIKPSPITSLW